MIIDPAALKPRERNALVNGLVSPRPIAWVSTLGPDGSRNLAPFSFFNVFSVDPPTIGLGPGSRDGVGKDSLRNIRASGEFVVNLVDRALAETANASSGEWGPEVDEWALLDVTAVESELVAAPRVAQSPAALECRVMQILELGSARNASNSLIVAWILRVHLRDEDMLNGPHPDPAKLDLVARMGADDWCTTRDRFKLPRPQSTDPHVVIAELHEQLAQRS
ncbi:MAG: flavin reductase family protein [Solirubrobacteraceae bacterium]